MAGYNPFADTGYICGICKKGFSDKDELGNRRMQRAYLKPSFTVKFGSQFVVQLPRMCYDCFDEIFDDVKKVCTKDRSKGAKRKVKARVPNRDIKRLPATQ